MKEVAQIRNLAEAFEYIKEMNPEGQWGADTDAAMRDAVARVLGEQMRIRVDEHLAEMERRGEADRRNGSYIRHLVTGIGDIELCVPRTRRYSPKEVVRAYARRSKDVDRAILAAFVLGVSTRKVADVLVPMLGERVSASTVSRIAKSLDAAVAAFHKRPLTNQYRALLFDGVVLSRKTGAGALKRPVLVALGIRHDGRKEIIDYRLAKAESEAEWERFCTNLYQRGLTGQGLEIIVVDGGAGLLAALPYVYHHVPVQRCWAHKTRNITDKVRKADREAVKRDIRLIYNAANFTQARKAARRFADKWEPTYPKAVRSLRRDLDSLLTFLRVFHDPVWRKLTRTTNAIERRFREVRRRTRPMGVFSDTTSMDRILFAVFTYENKNQNIPSLFLLTQNS